MVRTVLLGLFAILCLGTSQALSLTITNDPGGRIGTYVDKYESLRNSGERVIIDGMCASACTLVLGYIPRERMCATARAKLGFHQAFYDQASSNSKQVVRIPDAEATKLLMNIYPVDVQDWIRRHHGLPSPYGILWLRRKALARLVPKCGAGVLPPMNFNWRGLY